MGFLREYCESWEEDTRWKRGDDLPVRVRRGCVHYLSTDLSVCYLADTINAMDDALFAQYMRYNLFVCKRPDMAGGGPFQSHPRCLPEGDVM